MTFVVSSVPNGDGTRIGTDKHRSFKVSGILANPSSSVFELQFDDPGLPPGKTLREHCQPSLQHFVHECSGSVG